MILYEYPFNERIRTYLRLEHLFRRLGDLVERSTALDHHFAITTIFEIMDVSLRADLKTDILKDLDRQKHALNSYRGNPAISESVLNDVTQQLQTQFAAINSLPGKVGQSLNDNDWLMAIRSRVAIPGGTCEFDLPAYYAWQQGSSDTRKSDLQQWLKPFVPLAESTQILLALLRDSGKPLKIMASAGHYQQSLPQGRTFQLLRLSIDPTLGLIPEISGNRLVASVRLMRLGPDDRLHTSGEDAAFDLTLCA